MTHSVIRPGDGLHYDWTNDHVVVKTELGVTDGRVTVVEDTLKPGFHLPRHHHRRTVEIFYVGGGFDQYMAELAAMTPEQLADAALMTTVGETYDTWFR